MMLRLPPGFRFLPTDEEIVADYLLRKVRGEQILWSGIYEIDLYGEKSPWDIFDDIADRRHYFFTKLKRFSKRVARAAGCGTWHESCGFEIYDSKEKHLIGHKKQFCYKVKQQGKGFKKSNWIMHEFSLAGASLVGEQERCSNWVFCSVYKKASETTLRRGIKRCLEDPCSSSSTSVIEEAPTPCSNETHQSKRIRCDVQSDVLPLQATATAADMPSSSCSSSAVDTGEDNAQATDSETHIHNADSDHADYGFYALELLGNTEYECPLSVNFVGIEQDLENHTWSLTDLETPVEMGCLPTDGDDDNSEFYGVYGYLPPSSTPERAPDLPLDTWMVDGCSPEEFFSTFSA